MQISFLHCLYSNGKSCKLGSVPINDAEGLETEATEKVANSTNNTSHQIPDTHDCALITDHWQQLHFARPHVGFLWIPYLRLQEQEYNDHSKLSMVVDGLPWDSH